MEHAFFVGCLKDQIKKTNKQGFLPPLHASKQGLGIDDETIDGDRWLSTDKERRDNCISDAFDFTQDFLSS